jgi:hypothetical protein
MPVKVRMAAQDIKKLNFGLSRRRVLIIRNWIMKYMAITTTIKIGDIEKSLKISGNTNGPD